MTDHFCSTFSMTSVFSTFVVLTHFVPTLVHRLEFFYNHPSLPVSHSTIYVVLFCSSPRLCEHIVGNLCRYALIISAPLFYYFSSFVIYIYIYVIFIAKRDSCHIRIFIVGQGVRKRKLTSSSICRKLVSHSCQQSLIWAYFHCLV